MNNIRLSVPELDLLHAWLEDETATQRELLAILEQQREALRRQDLKGLEACLASAQPVLTRAEELTRRRMRIMTSLARRVSLPIDQVRLATLEAFVPEEERSRFNAARAALSTVLTNISRMNRGNAAVVRSGLDLQRAIVHRVFGGDSEPATYDRRANSRQMPPVLRVLSQEL
jgi:hypothetical protein